MNKLLFERLLALVNSALWKKEIDVKLFAKMDDQAWNDLYRLAIRHGVMAITFEGVKTLPAHLQAPRKLKMAWALSSENIEQKYTHMLNTVKELSNTFSDNNINMLVFKGLNLSYCYPIPPQREFGDIDIYLFGRFDEGERCLTKIGAKKKETANYKHSNYIYKNIPIENHAYLLNVHDSASILQLNNTLIDILTKNKTDESCLENGILFPPPQFTAVFLIIHAIKHLSYGALSLRTYCDWALFLQTYGNSLDISQWEKILTHANLIHLAKVLNELTFRWLAVSPSYSPFPPNVADSVWVESIENEMWQPLYPDCKSENLLKVFLYRCKRHCYVYKRHCVLYKKNHYKNYPKYFTTKFISHLKVPKSFFKLN